MKKLANGGISYTPHEWEQIQASVQRLLAFAEGGPWTFEDTIKQRAERLAYRRGLALLDGEEWTQELAAYFGVGEFDESGDATEELDDLTLN